MVDFAKEPLKDCWEEFSFLCHHHWSETEMYRHGQRLNLKKDLYLYYNDSGSHHFYTVRDKGKMIGNCGMYVTESMYTGKKTAEEDTIFLLPEYRKGGIAYRFMLYIENDLVTNLKVAEITQTTKLNKHNASRLLEKMGFEFVAKQYSKQYEENI